VRQVFTTESIDEFDRLDDWNHIASTVFWPLAFGMPRGTRYVASVTHVGGAGLPVLPGAPVHAERCHRPVLSNGSLGIVGTLLRSLSNDQPAWPQHDETHDRATAFIDLNLHVPGLSPADVAAACHVSLRQLYRVFEATGQTVAGAIRDRRLARARALLETMTPGTPIGWVGAKVGFPSPEQFTRAFREAHGLPPGAWRARQAAAPTLGPA
jgi:AraC-like DNA-binding protein